jgi:hypothetical protein
VAMVEMWTRLAIERARTVTLHLQQARRSSIPTFWPASLGILAHNFRVARENEAARAADASACEMQAFETVV